MHKNQAIETLVHHALSSGVCFAERLVLLDAIAAVGSRRSEEVKMVADAIRAADVAQMSFFGNLAFEGPLKKVRP